MKHTKRPSWMAPARRAPENKPVQGLSAVPKALPRPLPELGLGPQQGQGYDPYDTIKTRKLDLDVWQGKPKRD